MGRRKVCLDGEVSRIYSFRDRICAASFGKTIVHKRWALDKFMLSALKYAGCIVTNILLYARHAN